MRVTEHPYRSKVGPGSRGRRLLSVGARVVAVAAIPAGWATSLYALVAYERSHRFWNLDGYWIWIGYVAIMIVSWKGWLGMGKTTSERILMAVACSWWPCALVGYATCQTSEAIWRRAIVPAFVWARALWNWVRNGDGEQS